MIRRTSEIPSGTSIDTDICIVGGGVAGTTLARELAGTRLGVVVLEGGTEARTDRSDDLYRGETVGLPYFDLDRCRTRALGGSGSCWGGFCRTFDDADFDVRPEIPHSGWPLTRDELLPLHERAHRILGLGPVDYSFEHWAARAPHLADPFAGGPIDVEVFQKSGFDEQTPRAELAAAPNVDVLLDATALELETDEDARRVTGVRVRGLDGPELWVRARHYVLAAGGIENARLLLASNRVRPGGLGNDHDRVGRFFMDHLHLRVGRLQTTDPAFRHRYFERWAPVDGIPVKTSAVVAADVRRREQLLRTFFELSPPVLSHLHGYRSLQHLRRELRRGVPVHNWRFHARNVWLERRLLFDHVVGRRIGRRAEPGSGPGGFELRVSAEPAPNPDSRVLLADRRDALGQRRVRLDWRISDLDRRHVQRSLAIFEQAVIAGGIGRLELDAPEQWPLWGHHHQIGTTRMSSDPRTGVVDPDGRVHGTENLHVAGSSVFPTAGAGTVTLMIVVLAIRLADRLRALG